MGRPRGGLTLRFGCGLPQALAALLVLASQSMAQAPLLRPGHGSGDPLWSWPTVLDSSLPRTITPGFRGRLSGWHPFRVKDLSALVWEVGRLGTGWGGMTSGAILSSPLSRELWVDLSLVRRFSVASVWIGGGEGCSDFGDGWRVDRVGGMGGIGVSLSRAAVLSRFALDRERRDRAWSWSWRAGGFLALLASLSLNAEIAEDDVGRSSALIGVVWRVTEPHIRPGATFAVGHNATLGTSVIRIVILPFASSPALCLWSHLHPFLGWTPGFSLSWGLWE